MPLPAIGADFESLQVVESKGGSVDELAREAALLADFAVNAVGLSPSVRFRTFNGLCKRLQRELLANDVRPSVVYRNDAGVWEIPTFQVSEFVGDLAPIEDEVRFLVDDRFGKQDGVLAAAWTLAAYQYRHEPDWGLKECLDSSDFGHAAQMLWASNWAVLTCGIGLEEMRSIVASTIEDGLITPDDQANDAQRLLNCFDEFVFVQFGLSDFLGYFETLVFDPECIAPERRYLDGWDYRCGTVAELVAAAVRLLLEHSVIFTAMDRSPRQIEAEFLLDCLDEDFFKAPEYALEWQRGMNRLMNDPGVPEKIGDILVPRLKGVEDLWDLLHDRQGLLDRLPECVSRPVVQLVREIARHLKLTSRLPRKIPFWFLYEQYVDYWGCDLTEMAVTVVGRESFEFVNEEYVDCFTRSDGSHEIGFFVTRSVTQAVALMFSANEIIRLLTLLQSEQFQEEGGISC